MEVHGIYRHFKGNEYLVLGEGKTPDGESYIIYQQLYGNHGYWMRPFEMFFDEKEQDGRRIRRFTRVGDSTEKLPQGEMLAAIRLSHSETLEQYWVTGDEKNGYRLEKA